jgi:hypothetical protein
MADITNTSEGEWPGYGESSLEPDHGATVSDTVKGKVSEVASSAGELIDDAKAKVQEWSADVAGAASSVKQGARNAANLAIEKGQNLEQELASFIRRYPASCLLAGFGIGLLVSHATRRR